MSDRLSALLSRFELHARVFHSGALCGTAHFDGADGVGHLHLLRHGRLCLTDGDGIRHLLAEPTLLFFPRPAAHRLDADERDPAELVCASIDFGTGDENPLLVGLPGMLVVPLDRMPGLDLTQGLLFSEAAAGRCGHDAVVNRLTEILIIQLLRYAIEAQLINGGVLAGLADPRLAKVLNALHATPGRPWTLAAMAEAAGMSRARFAVHFTRRVGLPPGDYLTGWRLGLACSLLRKGLAVKQVAGEVGYANASALARAFSQRFGTTPTAWLLQTPAGDPTI